MKVENIDSRPGYLGPPHDWPTSPETWWKMRAILIEWLQSGDEPDEPIEPGKRHFKPCSRSYFRFLS